VRLSQTLTAVEAHAEGEQGTCYIGSVFEIPGVTAREKLQHVNEVDDRIRRFLCFEPRGRSQASANIVFPSTHPEADAGFIILQADRAHAMSGSNTICVVTALLETGTIAMQEPETLVTLETAAGLVRARATCNGGRCERVTLDGVPSFVEALDVPLTVPGYGEIEVDIAYGGCYYVLADVAQLELRLTRDRARDVVDAGAAIFAAASEAIQVRHPEIPEIDFISYAMLTGDDDPAAGRLRGATVLSGRVDRSPCGTGSSARLACLSARGLAGAGSRFTATSLIDSEFTVEHVGNAEVGGRAAVLPRISGRGWVVGTRITAVDPSDPYQLGYVLSDVWGNEIAEGADRPSGLISSGP
jgi:proline racemase